MAPEGALKAALPGLRVGVFFIAFRYIALVNGRWANASALNSGCSSLLLQQSCSQVLLMVQTTAVVLTMRYSRTTNSADGQRYLSSTAVVMSEVFKILGSLLLLWVERKVSLWDAATFASREILAQWKDTLKLAVPALLYTIQNNLLFVALSNLPAATYQVQVLSVYQCRKLPEDSGL